jgi:hypothetical protein
VKAWEKAYKHVCPRIKVVFLMDLFHDAVTGTFTNFSYVSSSHIIPICATGPKAFQTDPPSLCLSCKPLLKVRL